MQLLVSSGLISVFESPSPAFYWETNEVLHFPGLGFHENFCNNDTI